MFFLVTKFKRQSKINDKANFNWIGIQVEYGFLIKINCQALLFE